MILAVLLTGDAKAQVAQLPPQSNPALLTPNSFGANNKQYHNLAPDSPEEIKLELPQKETNTIASDEAVFHFGKIILHENTLLSDETLNSMLSEYTGKPVSLSELETLTAKITRRYQENGFYTSQAYIPPQETVDGILLIEVREGRVGKLEVAGNRFFKAGILKRQLDLKTGDAFNANTLTAALQRMNRQPDELWVKAALKAGEFPGETDIRLDVQESERWRLSASFDNQGRPFIGQYRYGLDIRNNNVSGRGDRLFGRLLTSESGNLQVAAGAYTLPLNAKGTEIGVNIAASRVNVDLGIENQPLITGSAYQGGLTLSQPLNRSRTWVLDAGVNAKRIASFFDEDRTSLNRIYSVHAGLTYDRPDPLGRTFFRTQQTIAPRRFNTDTPFWKNESTVIRLVALPRRNLLIVKASGQFAPTALPAAEQFQIGGIDTVRGYSEGLLLGDRGYSLSVEHRWPVPLLGKISPWLDKRLQGATFFDLGQTWLDKSSERYLAGISDKPEQTTLMAAGMGLRVQLSRLLTGFVDVGYGMLNRAAVEPIEQPRFRVHFGVRSTWQPHTLTPPIPKMALRR